MSKQKSGSKKQKPIRVGVIGVGRGMSYAHAATSAIGMQLVALCDGRKDALRKAGKALGVKTYTRYDRFLQHDMDAVVLANYFHEHAPFAIKALDAGKHVMSETSCNSTLAEGVALCRKVEETGLIYMLAENYPYTVFNLEMRRLYRAGVIGDVRYAEGEYNHPMHADDINRISCGEEHWRNCIPSTYYCTHAMAPLMQVTNTMPVRVNARAFTTPRMRAETARRGDGGSVILCEMDNGAIFRLMGMGIAGHSNWYRFHGTRGAMENTRGAERYFGPEEVRVWHDPWDLKPGEEAERVYKPDWPLHGELAKAAGHGGGDFWTNYEFAKAIRSGRQPFLNVYRGVSMSSVGILAWRSALANGEPIEVPDFRKEKQRKIIEDDHWTPFSSDARPADAPPSIEGFRKASKQGLAAARKDWKKQGYTGQ
jgi:predicted dehydrogenase